VAFPVVKDDQFIIEHVPLTWVFLSRLPRVHAV
jgi:hypothetical protein